MHKNHDYFQISKRVNYTSSQCPVYIQYVRCLGLEYVCTYACKYASYNLMQVLLFTKNGDMKGKNKPVKAKPVV